MSKKLVVGNYRFSAEESTVYVKGSLAPERFLLITNVNSGTIIYNFANSDLGFNDTFYDPTNDETALALKFDATSMNDNDPLQIFYQEDYQEITPAEDILDPVGKLRVSNPQNLIDTDFEYSLQGTKWETIQTVNNIPTVYNNSGDTPLDAIVSVETVSGSKAVRVTTEIPHNLSIGDPINVQGVDQYQAQGFFIVTNVPTSTTFFFELDIESNFTGDISGSYTTIVPGKFFEGSTLPVSTADGAITDDSDVSTISVTTDETHGFSENTRVYLRNTVGPKILNIDNSEATAPDGRPFVDTQSSFVESLSVDMQTTTGRGSFRERPVVPYDWESTYTTYLGGGDWDTVNNQVTWLSHNLRDGYALLFNTPYHDLTDGGIDDGTVVYVKVVDDDTIELHTTGALNDQISLSTLNNKFGAARLGLIYKVEGANGTTRLTEANVANNRTGLTTQEDGGQIITDPNNRGGTQYTTAVDVTAVLGGNPTNVVIQDFLIAGDFNSTTETITVTIGTTTVTSRSGQQSAGFFNMLDTTFDNFDVSPFLYTSGGRTFFNVTHQADTSVNDLSFFSNPSGCYRINIAFEDPNAGSGVDKEFSGGDLYDETFGLGVDQPDTVVAFQNRTPSFSFNFNDGFSSRFEQRTNGRYGTLSSKFNNSITGASSDGTFEIDFFEGSNEQYGSSSEIFYVFARSLTSDRNTIFSSSHGIEDSQVVTITVDSTDFSNGERFAFGDNQGNVTDMPQTFQARVSTINNDLIRIQTQQNPRTDDVARMPDNFTVQYQVDNETFNTVFVSNHKITAQSEAVYENISGNVIPPLTDGQTVFLDRLNDNRLFVFTTGSGNTATVTPVIEQNNNSTQTLFVDLETAAGFIPGSGIISQIEFRGDFSATSEFMTITFDDGDSYEIGRFDDQGDTSIYTTSTTFQSKDVSSLLTESGGLVGFNVEVDPESSINFGPGGGPWWGLRFTVQTEEGIVLLDGTGTGAHGFTVANLVGAYDGVFEITDVPSPNTFDMSSDFRIPIREFTFTSSEINDVDNTITFSEEHNLITGEKITYDENGNTTILPSGVTDTFAIVVDDTTIKLASSSIDAKANNAISLTGQTGTHIIRSSNVIKAISGNGTVSISSGSNIVEGSGTNFLTTFKRFDKIDINNGSFVEEFTVNDITSPTAMTLFETASNNITDADYYYITQLSLRPDGFSLHKPFDGGVDITAGTSPNSRIARQTRKYFRYQSGKGIQTSFAINFNPPRIVKVLIRSTGNVATIIAQEQHNLKVGDLISVSDATVTTGNNFYNGTFAVDTVEDPFTFTYVMDGTPTDVRAGGFPTYVREGWTESFVRAGMFDDQNGFFYEFDGQKLYAVRRSSTKQIAGTINVTRGSQVVTGNDTSFTTQLQKDSKVVIRGQTYIVNEISSDSRMIIQPAYRGLDSTNVKCTITIDTRTPQDEWNIDKADGTGFTGFNLDLTKIQMAYMDYSWYGAGKIRYGFKDNKGHIRYFHEYVHNNKLNESYFRSGNLPARYEIENGRNATTAPTLFHFGTSIIMDGTFDDDKAYQFTGQSVPFAFTNGGSSSTTSTANSTFEQVTIDGRRVFVYAIPISESVANTLDTGMTVTADISGAEEEKLFISQLTVDGSNSKVFLNYPATSSDPTGGSLYSVFSNGSSITFGEPTGIDLTRPIPLISVRLAPSVDSGLTGALGEREIINRMQLALQQASVTSNQDIELFLIQNALPSVLGYQKAPRPSLSEIIKHDAGDELLDGITIFSTKSSAGSITVGLDELLEIGNSILGGDGIFPAGPDLLTLAIQPQQVTGIDFNNPFIVTGKISWSESQA